MNSLMKRTGLIAASVGLLALVGCGGGSTEIPLAKVAPVTLKPLAKKKPSPYSRISSPDVLPGQN